MSKRKDARWQGAHNIAGSVWLGFEDFTPEGWQKLLDMAEGVMSEDPLVEDLLYAQWRERNGEVSN